MAVPVFYLRKPWYLILAHASQALKYASQNPAKRKVEAVEKPVIHRNAVVKKKIVDEPYRELPFSDQHFSKEEKKFIEENGITFSSHYYSIKRNAIADICLQIQLYFKEEGDRYKEMSLQKLAESYKKAFPKKEPPIRSPLQDKVNTHFSNVEKGILPTITVPLNLALFVCEAAKNSVSRDEKNLAEIEKTIKVIEEKYSNESPVHDPSLMDMYGKFWQTTAFNKLPQKFYNSHWRIYERTDGRSRANATWGIATQYFYIGKMDINGYVPVKILTLSSEYNGVVTYNPQSSFLIGHLVREATDSDNLTTPVFFAIQLNSQSDQSLMIGHSMYYALAFSKFMTKTFIFEKCDEKFTPEDVVDIELKKFNEIKLSIRQFLSSRSRNRLTMPSTNISNLNEHDLVHSLQSWVNNRIKHLQFDDLLPASIGKYYVCYFYGEVAKAKYTNSDKEEDKIIKDDYLAKYIRIDELDISYDENSVDFYASYIHKQDVSKKALKSGVSTSVFKGKVRRKQSTVEIILEEKTFTNSKKGFAEDSFPIANFILINFSVDDVGLKNKNEAFFSGIITGLSDLNCNPVSFRCFLLRKRGKHDKKNVTQKETTINFSDKENVNSKRILDYFRNHLDESQIKAAPLPKLTTFEKFSNIHSLIKNGGSIKIENSIVNGGVIFRILCFLTSDIIIADAIFESDSIDEALSNMDKWLSNNNRE
ncbi:hypothetical protein [Runella sp. SP2]|uniref:hypothetical protein n=1 Tax=Runella sp. SP2 TaxID=2268026 RepID=UPI0013DDB8B3|nr:hypothetical protein [Runella sp. SP2]